VYNQARRSLGEPAVLGGGFPGWSECGRRLVSDKKRDVEKGPAQGGEKENGESTGIQKHPPHRYAGQGEEILWKKKIEHTHGGKETIGEKAMVSVRGKITECVKRCWGDWG